MKYVCLGNSGLKVSRICLGTLSFGSSKYRNWILEEDESRPFFKKAIELGINFFDTANAYSMGRSEEITGRALRDTAKRDEVIIATKVFNPMGDAPNSRGLSRKHIMDSIDSSLRRLYTDYVDLYQIHRWDDTTPIEETLEALNDLLRAGKIRYIGASSMYAWQFCKALYIADLHGWTRFVSMQNHYNLIYREEEREMIPLCIDQGIGILPYSPMARGFLAQNRTRDKGGETTRSRSDDIAHRMYYGDDDLAIRDRVIELADKRGCSATQIALAWMLQKPGITSPIIGCTKIKHLEEAVAAVDIMLSNEELALIEEPYRPHPVLGH